MSIVGAIYAVDVVVCLCFLLRIPTTWYAVLLLIVFNFVIRRRRISIRIERSSVIGGSLHIGRNSPLVVVPCKVILMHTQSKTLDVCLVRISTCPIQFQRAETADCYHTCLDGLRWLKYVFNRSDKAA